MRKIIISLTAAIYGLMLTVTPAIAPDVTASTTVAEVCDLSMSTTSISFGVVPDDTTSDSETVVLTNEGNTDITGLTVEGTDWVGPAPLPVSATSFEDDDEVTPPGVPFNEMLALFPGTAIFGLPPLPDDSSDTVDFRVTIPDDQPAGDYVQTITFTFGC